VNREIELNIAKVDYLTLTTFDMALSAQWFKLVGIEARQERRMQYSGFSTEEKEGTIFWGQGKQKEIAHCMLQISGALADIMFWLFQEVIIEGKCKVSRIDVQMTVRQPDGWAQWSFGERLQIAGKKPSIARSTCEVNGQKVELMTVYSGARSSGRLTRVYQKVDDTGKILLRYEVEFGRDYAHALALALADGTGTKHGSLNSELMRLGDANLREVFWVDAGGLFAPKQARRIVADKSEEWLLNVVLPVFVRTINADGADPAILELFLSAIESRIADSVS
jgi:hypothetical protein